MCFLQHKMVAMHKVNFKSLKSLLTNKGNNVSISHEAFRDFINNLQLLRTAALEKNKASELVLGFLVTLRGNKIHLSFLKL